MVMIKKGFFYVLPPLGTLQGWNSVKKWVGWRYELKFSVRKKYDLPPKQIQASPNLMVFSVGAGIEIPIEKKYENLSKQIRFNISPNLMVSVCQPPAFLDVSRHFVKKKTPRNPSNSEFICMGEPINRFLHVWCPISHSICPLLFPHHLTGGCGTRLSIRRQDPNNYSDTETRCLV